MSGSKRGDTAISVLDREGLAKPGQGLSLLFPAGLRPSADDVVRLSRASQDLSFSFSVSHQPCGEGHWLELLAFGLTFDLVGLSPGPAQMFPEVRHHYGLPDGIGGALEAISLYPGQHLGEGANLLPVVRSMAGLAAELTGLEQARAVVWHPSGAAVGPGQFATSVRGWLAGGAFPALGLTALRRGADGALSSEGLTFFTGQELRLEPSCAKTPGEAGKIAVRLIHRLVESEPVLFRQELPGPDGERLIAEPREGGRVVRVWRQG